jgi:predicted O-linked N-acetylglucosamine transferase (SPINDLY family)
MLLAGHDENAVAEVTAHAVTLHQRGRLADAEKVYAAILQVRPDHFDALHLLGVLRQQQGNGAEAVRLIGAALKMDPQSIDALCNFGAVLNALSRHDEALAAFDQALALRPELPAALNYRGNTLMQLGRLEEALAAFDRTLVVKPTDLEALISRGNALVMLDRHEQALVHFDRALAVQPDHPLALANRGLVLTQLKRHEEALACYRKALPIAPDRVAALNNYGNALVALGRAQEALAICDEALVLAPDRRDTLKQRIAVLQALARHDEALQDCDRILAVTPDDPETNFSRGFSLASLDRLDEAMESYQKARAFNHMPARNMLAICRMATAEWAQADEIVREACADLGVGKPANPLLVMARGLDAATQLKAARSYARILVPVPPKPFLHSAAMRADKLRVAYVTTAFREHPIATAIANLFERHDREHFEIIGVSIGKGDTSGIRARMIAALDQFHHVAAEPNRYVAKLLNDLQVHVAVDLNGWTDGCRPEIFAYRPAPIQVSYLGYAGTSGTDFIDYIVADETVLPFDRQPFFTEKIVHLPDCYHVNDATRRISPEVPARRDLGLPDQGFVFCCFNHSGKITAPIFDIWMRLLTRVQGSVLWLSKINKHAEANLRREAAARGVDPGRLVIAGWTDSIEDHLSRHRAADLFVDTLPYNAHSTASDALFAGLPVVTCTGTEFAGRVGASLLKTVGLPELITNSLEDYEAMALSLATDRGLLAALRRKLEENRRTSPLFNNDRFCRGIEAAYSNMWDIYRRGESPKSFRIKASVAA